MLRTYLEYLAWGMFTMPDYPRSLIAFQRRFSDDRAGAVGESADLLFHLLMLLADLDIPLDSVLDELDRREGVSGIVEKAARPSD